MAKHQGPHAVEIPPFFSQVMVIPFFELGCTAKGSEMPGTFVILCSLSRMIEAY